MSDVYANTLGVLLGGCAAVASSRLSGKSLGIAWNPPVFILLACWLGNRLYPYVPVIDLHKYWDALKPLWMSPQLDGIDIYVHAVYWLAIGVLLDALLGASRSRVVLALFFPALIVARTVIARIILSPDEIAGGFIAVAIWCLWLWRVGSRVQIVAGFLIVSVVIQALEPFQFSSIPRPFGWIPFRSLVWGSPETAVLSFFEKVFQYGCLVWLLKHGGNSWLRATLWSATLVMGLRWMQIYIPGRSAEITDITLLLIIAGVMGLTSHLDTSRKSG